MYTDTSGLTGIRAVLGVSTLLLVPTIVIAVYASRPARPRHATWAWYAVTLATVCLLGYHASGIATAAAAWTNGRDSGPNAFDQWNFDRSKRGLQDSLFKLLALFSCLHSLFVVFAGRAAFYEIVKLPSFMEHKKARNVLLGFDVVVGVGLVATLVATGVLGEPCCEGSSQTAGELMVASLHDQNMLFGFPWIVIWGFLQIAIGAFLARAWARKHNVASPLANAMVSKVLPMLLLQTLTLVIFTVVWGVDLREDINVFYASIPFRTVQVATLGVLAWVLRTSPIVGHDGAEVPLKTEAA